MDYSIIRSGRKSVALSIDKEGRLIVRAPFGFPEYRIREIVNEKADWINKHSSAAEIRAAKRNDRLSRPPEALPLFGELRAVSHEEPYGYIDGVIHIPGNMTLEELLPYLHRLYARIAKEYLVPRVWAAAKEMGFDISAVRINSAGTRWGSCSAKKSINLSQKLIVADTEAIDYVIVHELCHTVHLDHSADFWALVEQFVPDHKKCRDKLAEVQKMLSDFGME
ncbi:MAG: M48 family metallopeptidase [Oscillospiraceae bacterium]|nr:M48 family metallopeptidase [Oscillospiraceae bacterium]